MARFGRYSVGTRKSCGDGSTQVRVRKTDRYSIGLTILNRSRPGTLPLPPGPSPLPARRGKLRCVVSWIARTWCPGAAQRRSYRRENLFRHHTPVGKKTSRTPPSRPGLVPDGARSGFAILAIFCPTIVPKAAGKQIHERNHLHPFDKPIPNDTELSSNTFPNQKHTIINLLCTC